MQVFYSNSYVGSGYAFDTTRKAKWIADSLAESPIRGVELVEPACVSRDQLASVHQTDYIRAIETGDPRDLADSQGFSWDAGLWPMALASNGGVVAAALAALAHGVAGSLSSGLHHARYAQGMGFCTFNGLAIAAQVALASGAAAVLVLDLDAHCGGGTVSLVEDNPDITQIDVSVSQYDSYQSRDDRFLDVVEDAADYLPAIARRLSEIEQQRRHFDICLYNAGMDPCQNCSIGGMAGITPQILAERERMVFDWCQSRQVPVAFVLAGGYVSRRLDQRALVELHRFTLSAAARIAH